MSKRRLLAALLGAALLAVVVWRASAGDVLTRVRDASVMPLVVAVALNIPVTVLRALRTRLLLRSLDAPVVPLRRLCGTQLVGQTLSGLTPGAVGDLTRAAMWHMQDGVPAGRGVVTVVVERIWSLLLLAAFGLGFEAPTLGGPWFAAVLVGLALLGVVLPALALSLGWARRWLRVMGRRVLRVRLFSRRAESIVANVRHARVALDSASLALWFTLLTLATFALSAAQIALVVSALGGSVPWHDAVGVYGLSQAGGSLSTLPFGLGTTDVIVVSLLGRAGVAGAVATGTALLLRGVVTMVIAVAACAVWVASAGMWRRAASAVESAAGLAAQPEVAGAARR